jgi:hypothetical protein
MSVVDEAARVESLSVLSGFRREFYACLTARADTLFELADAVLFTGRPVSSLAELSLEPVHRRGHGAMYAALVRGRIDFARLRRALSGVRLPRGADGQISIALDVTAWPRPDAECSPERLHCHRECRCDGRRQTVPGWPYQVAAALGGGRSSWTGPLDVVRMGPDDDPTEVTAAQIRDLLARLREAGQWQEDDPPVLFVLDAGYDIVRLSWLLADEPVRLLGRIRSNRVMHAPPGKRRGTRGGRRPRHGTAFRLADPAGHPEPVQETTGTHPRYGTLTARCWGHLHPKLERRASFADHDGEPPIVEGTLLHLQAQPLPGHPKPRPLWLWHSDPDATAHDIDRLWRIYLRRFDIEHTFRFLKQTLGLTRPRLRTPEQADRWAWLILAVYTQLRLARTLTDDLRRPWERPTPQDQLTPGRVHRGYRRLHHHLGTPAHTAKATHPGPGRPPGRPTTPAPRHRAGKTRRKHDMPRRGSTTTR